MIARQMSLLPDTPPLSVPQMLALAPPGSRSRIFADRENPDGYAADVVKGEYTVRLSAYGDGTARWWWVLWQGEPGSISSSGLCELDGGDISTIEDVERIFGRLKAPNCQRTGDTDQ